MHEQQPSPSEEIAEHASRVLTMRDGRLLRDVRQTPSRLFTPRFLRVLLAQTTFSFGWSLFLLAPKYVGVELGADSIVVGNLSAMSGLFSIATIPLAARGIDRLGSKAFFAAGCTAVVAVATGFLLVHDLGPLMYVTNGLIGAAFIFAFNAGATLATEDVPPKRLGEALGVFGASNLVMNGVSAVVGEKLAARAGWDSVFVLAIIAAIAALAIAAREPAPRPSSHTQTAQPRATTSLRALSGPLASSMLIGSAFSAMFVFSQPYALERGAHEVGNFYVGFTIAAVFTRTLLGRLGDRFGRVRVSRYACCLYAASACSMIWLVPSVLVFYGAVFGCAHGILYPTLNAVLMERVGLHQRGRAMTLYSGAFNVGQSLSGVMFGLLARVRGYPAVYVGAALLATLAFVCLLGRAPLAAAAATSDA